MIAVALKGLAARKVRALLTALAVVIGVSMVSGTLILTDTMQKTFDGLFAASYDETDAVIQGKQIVEKSTSGSATIPAALLTKVRALPEVAAAGGTVSPTDVNSADIIGKDGKAVAKESLGTSIDPANARFSPLRLKTGVWPVGPEQVVIDAGTAAQKHYGVGDSVKVATPGKTASYRVTGTASYGEVDSLGFGSIAVWDLKTAQSLLDRDGRFDSISLAAKRGTSPAELVRAVRPLVAPPLRGQGQRATGRGRTAAEADKGLSYIRYFLLGFGGIALFVGAFVIFNTLSITVAQRTREFATLRTLGASRKQVMRSVRLEGLVVGAGRLLDRALPRLRHREGHDRAVQRDGCRPPEGRDRLRVPHGPRLGGGRDIDHPARDDRARAARHARAADRRRAGGVDPARVAVRRALPQTGLGVVLASIAAIAVGTSAASAARRAGLLLGVGVLALFLGVAFLAPQLVKPLARLVGWPARRAGGVAGELAEANAVRNPARTASTAAALMIGLTLVTVVAVLGAGLNTSTRAAVTDQLRADYVVDGERRAAVPGRGGRGARPCARRGGRLAGPQRQGGRAAARRSTSPASIRRTIARFYRFDWTRGVRRGRSRQLGTDGALVTKSYAKAHHLAVGGGWRSRRRRARSARSSCAAIYDPPQVSTTAPRRQHRPDGVRRCVPQPEERVHVPRCRSRVRRGARGSRQGLRRRQAAHRGGLCEGRHEGRRPRSWRCSTCCSASRSS